jgi:hypothetical protein
MNNTKNFL